MRLIGVTRGCREAGERAVVAVGVVEREKGLEAEDPLKCLRAVTKGRHEAPTQVAGGDEQLGCDAADASAPPRLQAADCRHDEGVGSGRGDGPADDLLLEERRCIVRRGGFCEPLAKRHRRTSPNPIEFHFEVDQLGDGQPKDRVCDARAEADTNDRRSWSEQFQHGTSLRSGDANDAGAEDARDLDASVGNGAVLVHRRRGRNLLDPHARDEAGGPGSRQPLTVGMADAWMHRRHHRPLGLIAHVPRSLDAPKADLSLARLHGDLLGCRHRSIAGTAGHPASSS
jgi:hypothetical protein